MQFIACVLCGCRRMKSASPSSTMNKDLTQLKVVWEELPVFISASSQDKPGRLGGVLGTSLY